MRAHLRLQEWWSSTGADISIATRPDEHIKALLDRYDLAVPDDFRRYLSESSPTEENWDEEMGNWWPLERLKNIPDEYEYEVPSFIPERGRRFVFFLDHCIWCWAWAISCADDETQGKIVLIGGQDERFVADSFSEFVDRYTTAWLSVS
jgi:hypothetical protein